MEADAKHVVERGQFDCTEPLRPDQTDIVEHTVKGELAAEFCQASLGSLVSLKWTATSAPSRTIAWR